MRLLMKLKDVGRARRTAPFRGSISQGLGGDNQRVVGAPRTTPSTPRRSSLGCCTTHPTPRRPSRGRGACQQRSAVLRLVVSRRLPRSAEPRPRLAAPPLNYGDAL
jgi:hypothetical protein